MTFAKRIRELRGEQTMAEFGKFINTKVTTISSWENGGVIPSVSKLMELSQILHKSMDYLVGISDDIKNPHMETPITKTTKLSDMLTSKDELPDTPSAILSYDKDIITYTTHPSNVLLLSPTRSNSNVSYVIPYSIMVMNSKEKPNIIMDNLVSIDDLDYMAHIRNYKTYKFRDNITSKDTNITESDSINRWNVLRHMSTLPQKWEEYFTTIVMSTQIYDKSNTEIWSCVVVELLQFYFARYIKHYSKQDISFNTFKHYIESNSYTDYKTPMTSTYISSNEILTDVITTNLYDVAIAVLRIYAEDEYINDMDKDTNMNIIDLEQPSLIIFDNAKPYNTDIFKSVKSIILDMIYNISMKKNKPTKWIIKLDHAKCIEEYNTKLAIALGKNQQFILNTDSSITDVNTSLSLPNIDTIINYYNENSDVYSMLQDRIGSQLVSEAYSILKTMVYPLKNDDIYLIKKMTEFNQPRTDGYMLTNQPYWKQTQHAIEAINKICDKKKSKYERLYYTSELKYIMTKWTQDPTLDDITILYRNSKPQHNVNVGYNPIKIIKALHIMQNRYPNPNEHDSKTTIKENEHIFDSLSNESMSITEHPGTTNTHMDYTDPEVLISIIQENNQLMKQILDNINKTK